MPKPAYQILTDAIRNTKVGRAGFSRFLYRFGKIPLQQRLYGLVALGVLSICGFVTFLGAQYYRSQNLRRSQEHYQRLIDQVQSHDVALRMAAKLGAATTDTSWEVVHKEKRAEMEQVVQQLIGFDPCPEARKFYFKLRESHEDLLKLESRAFSIIGNGQSDFAEAIKLLDSSEYQQKRDAFQGAFQDAGRHMSVIFQDRAAAIQNNTIGVSVSLLLLSLMLVMPILRVLRLTKELAREREVAEQQLGRLNSCLLSFENNSLVNIRSLVNLCAELLQADGVLYQRTENDTVRSVASCGKEFCPAVEARDGSLTESVLEHVNVIPLCWRACDSHWNESARLERLGCRSYVAQAVRSGEEAIGVLHIFYSKDVSWTAQNLRFITIVSSAIAPEERRLAMVETLRRSEANLQSEREQLAVTLRSITDGVISTDLQNKVVLMNRVAENLTGWTSEEARGKSLEEVFGVPKTSIHPVDDDTETLRLAGVKLCSRTGEVLSIEGTCAPIFHDDETIIGHLVVFSDQTEKQRLQAQVALSSKLQSIGQLAAGIAHEINTPMQFIGDNTSFLQKSFGEFISLLALYRQLGDDCARADQSVGILKAIADKMNEIDAEYLINEIPTAFNDTLSGIERVTKLVKAMKTFSHPTQGNMQLCDLNQSIEATVNVSRNEWKYVADVEMDLDPKLPMVPCLIDELNQVVLNIINNSVDAIKDVIARGATKKGKIRVASCLEENEAHIVIRDSGTGMSDDVARKIFDPFFTTKEPGKGTGQGLAISHDIIVNKHKGRIDVESKLGEGTQFTIVLPIRVESRN